MFFRWIKQHLRIKSFYGTSENAVKTQIWIAVSVYLLVEVIKKTSEFRDESLHFFANFELPISVKRVEDAYISYCPSLGIDSEGKTKIEALKNLRKAIDKSTKVGKSKKVILFDPHD